MNRSFKLRFDQLRENDPTSTGHDTGAGDNGLYPSSGHTRNVCLVWPDGRRAFLNYAYLVASEFEPNNERNLIRLSFSSHSVALHGYSLESLFMALLDHLPRIIAVTDPRYVLDEDKAKEVIVEIVMQKNES